MFTYADAERTLGKRETKKVQNNTYLHRLTDDTIGVRLHQTYIVRLHADGTATLNTGGWYSKTTADRIRTYSPATIIVKGGRWYISRTAERWYPGPLRYTRTVGWGERQPVTPENRAYRAAVKEWERANLLPFADGVRVNAKGRVIDAPPTDEAPEVVTAAWDRTGWSGPVTMADNRAAHQARIAALLGGSPWVENRDDIHPGVRVYTMSHDMIRACPHYIMVPEHYRADGSCKCDDANDPNMAEWGYTWDATEGRWS